MKSIWSKWKAKEINDQAYMKIGTQKINLKSIQKIVLVFENYLTKWKPKSYI